MAQPTVRPPAVAGLFYDAAPRALRQAVEACLAAPVPGERSGGEAGEAAARGPIKALIAPHAGYVYSGPIAGAGFRRLTGRGATIRRVVVIGPAHRVAFEGLALPADEAFATPLGTVPVDPQGVGQIRDLPQVAVSRQAHAAEHSLEVELPFLQTVLEEFSIVPLVVGRAAADEVAEVCDRLWGGAETLFVASSDLSHFLSYEEATGRDRRTAERILAFDGTLSPYDACGSGAVNGLLRAAARRGLSAELIDLRNSGDTAGDRDRVVGYAAIALRERA